MWVRGLKQGINLQYNSPNECRTLCGCVDWNFSLGVTAMWLLVAPYVGAWIETRCSWCIEYRPSVAPYVGAWIETSETLSVHKGLTVAPYVGAWIETFPWESQQCGSLSHPMWVRGLKLGALGASNIDQVSHPMWVRGLKLRKLCRYTRVWQSHPMWVRGLKLRSRAHRNRCPMSHPMWVRGLKLPVWYDIASPGGRTLCGCVDWNFHPIKIIFLFFVAPYVGAWIETECLCDTPHLIESHPMWVRGLKQEVEEKPLPPPQSRTLCGCVDWNFVRYCQSCSRSESHPMWVRGLKHSVANKINWYVRRTLCGCVDWNNSSF